MFTDASLKKYILDYLHPKLMAAGMSAEPEPEFNLIASGLLDSLGFLQLVAEVEAHFAVDVDFSEQDPLEFTCLDGFIRCIISTANAPDLQGEGEN